VTPNICVVWRAAPHASLADDAEILVEVVDDRGEARARDHGALGLADRRLARLEAEPRLAACGVSPRAESSVTGAHVTLVGAGIVNLMIALELVENGARIDVYDKGPDPRNNPPWQRLGSTHGGQNARMFCFTEADNYNDRSNAVYSGMREAICTNVIAGGWLALPPDDLSPDERAWIDNFTAVPEWRAEIFAEDIYQFNVTSGTLWERVRQSVPRLFEGVDFTPGVLRLYSQPEKVAPSTDLHRRLGSFRNALDLDELRRNHPVFEAAIGAEEVAGAFEVRGFTLNIHRLARRLLDELEKRGVRFHFGRQVTSIESNSDHHVVSLKTPQGVVRSEHYVVSPGAYGGSLLRGTRSSGKIQGILGTWLILPNPEPCLRWSVKIHQSGHVGEDTNVTLGTDHAGRPILILGSGYGFIGEHCLDMGSPEVACLQSSLASTAQRYFPDAFEISRRSGTLDTTTKACVRPFTSTGLGVFETLPTSDGGRLIVATGHNTGGFAQAPAVAEAVTATLRGRPHPMQSLYDPERGVRNDGRSVS
jgi:D-amino-acid dehydrogenase